MDADAPARAAGATEACVTVGAATPDSRGVNDDIVSTMDLPSTCTLGGYWTYVRFGSCMRGTKVDYTLRNDKGAILGTATLEIDSTMELRRTNPEWNESVTVTMTASSPAVPSLNVAFDASCSSGCSMTTASAWAGTRALSLGQRASGTVIYRDQPATNARDTTTTAYHMFITQTGTIPVQPNAGWSNPREIRCDYEVGGIAGCVYPSIRANLDLSLANYGAAAVTYWFAQSELIDHWGASDAPLHRLANTSSQDANRRRTCEDGTFIPMPAYVDSDSCDEYPFAATMEGGTTGGLCAEIVPQLENGIWNIYGVAGKTINYAEKCVRGHVPSYQNSAAGGALGSLTTKDRILDGEAYTVTIIS